MRITNTLSALAVVLGSASFGAGLSWPKPAHAFLEDICINRAGGGLKACLAPASACLDNKVAVDRGCLLEAVQFATIPPGRSMIHADSTYFIAQALGYRADVAYWITAYDEVADYAVYAPIDQCGVQATAKNTGASYITAAFNGFQRTNTKTDGPIDHYVVSFSPGGDGDDVHGAGGVQAVYPLHYPKPGYPAHIDDIYQGLLFDLRQWAMQPGTDPGLLCTAGLTTPNGASNFSGSACLAGATITGKVPLVENFGVGPALNLTSGPKVLNYATSSTGAVEIVTYDKLRSWLDDPTKTSGVLFDDPARPPVPVQVARIGLYLHVLQDTSSHATFCGDDAPSPPGGKDKGTYMAMSGNAVRLVFGTYCATGPHLAGHVQETGAGDNPLPLRDYVALNNTLDELIVFGNTVAKANGWIVNSTLLPPDVVGGKSAAGQSAADLKARLIGRIVQGAAWSRSEVYASGVVTLPLQQTNATSRLQAMNAALKSYSDSLEAASPGLTPLALMPGNSAVAGDTRACFK